MLTLGPFPSLNAAFIAFRRYYRAGFNASDITAMIIDAAKGKERQNINAGNVYAGLSTDDALGAERMRLSIWLFLPLRQLPPASMH